MLLIMQILMYHLCCTLILITSSGEGDRVCSFMLITDQVFHLFSPGEQVALWTLSVGMHAHVLH